MSNLIKTAVLVAIVLQSWAAAKSTSYFNINLKKGEYENLFLKEGVFLRIAPTSELKYSIDEEVLWSALKVGDKLLIGTGSGARLYVFDLRTDKLSHQFAIEGASEVTALLLGPNNRTYAAVGPEGKVYQLSSDFKSIDKTPVVTIPGQFIWSMAHDGNSLYLASGNDGKGVLYKVDLAKKQAMEIFKTDEGNVLMVRLHAGKIYASTSGQGYLYEMTTEGQQAKVLYDAGQDINHFTIHEGYLYLGAKSAANGFVPPPKKPPSQDQIRQVIDHLGNQLDKGNIETAAVRKSANQSKRPPPPPNKGGMNLNMVQVNLSTGKIKNVMSISDGKTPLFMSSLFVHPKQGRLYFNVYKEADKSSLVYTVPLTNFQDKLIYSSAPAFSTMAFAGDADRTFFYTGNTGDLYELKQNLKEGHYVSEVLDARETVRWGGVRYTMYGFSGNEANRYLKVFARTGNTSSVMADGQWSDWRPLQSGKVTSDQSRFIQLKFVMNPINATTSPMIEGIRLYYGRGNLPTEVKQVTWNNSQHSIAWTVSNPDKDQMLYEVYYSRQKGDPKTIEWNLLKDEIRGTRFGIPKKSFPDGEYRFKVVASDILANGRSESLVTEKVSKKYLIDNTAPDVVVNAVTKQEVKFTVKDAFSIIRSVRYSRMSMYLDTFPNDALFDSKEEAFTINIEELESEHLILHIVDEQGNSLYKTIELTNN